jgi:pimeloyl-ACP methyl ester carboxylesterase
MIVYFFCGALCSAASIQSSVQEAQNRGYETLVFTLDTNPFTANHTRDLETYRAAILEKSSLETQRIYFAFSGGAKFATKLALDPSTQAQGLFLLDPVDGPPPVGGDLKKFPVYLEGSAPLLWRNHSGSPKESLLRILSTELGEKPGYTGVPCVPAKYGSAWFSNQMGARAEETFRFAGVGHLDVLDVKPPFPMRNLCPSGKSSDTSLTPQQVAQKFGAFLDEI